MPKITQKLFPYYTSSLLAMLLSGVCTLAACCSWESCSTMQRPTPLNPLNYEMAPSPGAFTHQRTLP